MNQTTLDQTECQIRGCDLKPNSKYCSHCTICLEECHFPFWVNCHKECYEDTHEPVDNAKAITSLVRGGYND
jgi:hypothetical protein